MQPSFFSLAVGQRKSRMSSFAEDPNQAWLALVFFRFKLWDRDDSPLQRLLHKRMVRPGTKTPHFMLGTSHVLSPQASLVYTIIWTIVSVTMDLIYLNGLQKGKRNGSSKRVQKLLQGFTRASKARQKLPWFGLSLQDRLGKRCLMLLCRDWLLLVKLLILLSRPRHVFRQQSNIKAIFAHRVSMSMFCSLPAETNVEVVRTISTAYSTKR